MRILVIAPEQLPVPPVKGGSVESCIYNIFSRMAETHQVTIASRSHPSLSSQSTSVGGSLKFIRIPYAKPSAYIKAVLSKVRGQPFDVIQVENRPAFVSQVRNAFPHTRIVLSLHSLHFMSVLSKDRAYSVLGKVNGVTSVVSFVTATMKKKFPKYAHKFRTAVPGVSTEKFRPRSAQYKHAIRKKWKVSGSFNVLFVGRIVPKKGLHTLVKAVAIVKKRHSNTALVAVGASWPGVNRQTPYIRRVRSLSKRLNVPIRFTGYIPPAHVHEMYHLGDVFVCPTQYKEGFATVNSEAMASGIPVIASNRGGIKEVVENGRSGLLISKYNSPQAFADAIRTIKESPGMAKKLSHNGRLRVVERFSWFNTVRSLQAQYRSI